MATTREIRRRIPRWARPLQRPCRFKGASGGRGSGKSHFFAEEIVEHMVRRPSARVVCIREVQRSLKFSAKALIESKIEELGVAGLFDPTATEIRRLGGSGICIFEGMQDHTADSIKSLEGFELAWVEEAQSISQRSLDLLTPTIRVEGSELWFSWNPQKRTDPVDVMFSTPDDDRIRVHSTYRDNPFLPSTLRREAEKLRRADPDKYAHVWEGAYDLGGKGRVYPKFLEKPFPEGNVDPSVKDLGGEILIGQDFNINPMATVIAVRAVDECHVLDCLLVPTSNTEEVCQEVRRRYPNRRVVFCPDPAGNARHTNARAGQTDFTIIRSFGFEVRAPSAHPPVVDRVNNVNAMLHDGDRRRLRIHPRAKHLIEALGGQTYKPDTNIPDKTDGYDHPNDALGYLLWQEFNRLGHGAMRVSTFAIG
ncbi:MAG: PBSX family phage terminase large subunit [Gemmatimonadaceae bacterium]|nr:PBSX family phage terminase large subunit [Gemmatimonadaceae bacterium]